MKKLKISKIISYLKKQLIIFVNMSIIFILTINTVFYISNKPLIIFPHNDNFYVYNFSDLSEGGNSIIKSFFYNDNYISCIYELKKGIKYPYAGFGLSYKSLNGMDVSKFDYIKIRIKSSKADSLKVHLRLFVPSFTRTQDIISYRYLVYYIKTSKTFHNKEINLKDLITEKWWYEKYNTDERIIGKPNYKYFYSIEISNNDNFPYHEENTIDIASISFHKSLLNPYLYIFILLLIILIVFNLLFLFIKFKKNKFKIIHKEIIVEDHEEINIKKIIEYISNNYNDPEISLEKINLETGIPENKISNLIKKHYKLSFKELLNKLRIDEAKNLLIKTDRNIIEIAFLVGYNNTTHFGREFKKNTGLTPREFKKIN